MFKSILWQLWLAGIRHPQIYNTNKWQPWHLWRQNLKISELFFTILQSPVAAVACPNQRHTMQYCYGEIVQWQPWHLQQQNLNFQFFQNAHRVLWQLWLARIGDTQYICITDKTRMSNGSHGICGKKCNSHGDWAPVKVPKCSRMLDILRHCGKNVLNYMDKKIVEFLLQNFKLWHDGCCGKIKFVAIFF